jgi:hypothetical protein
VGSVFSRSSVVSAAAIAGLPRASPAVAMRLLFGAYVIDAMSENKTEIRNLRIRGEQPFRTPEACSPHSDMPSRARDP